MSAGGSKQHQDASDDQILLMISFVVACHHCLPSVSVEFFKLQLSFLNGMLKLVRVFVKHLVDCWTKAV